MVPEGTIAEAVVGGVLTVAVSGWLCISIIYYWAPVANRVGKLDPMILIPQWSFFAPVPNKADFHLFVRWRLSRERDQVSPWQEYVLARERPALALFWNPDRRIRKGFFDLSSEICRMAHLSREELLVSAPYLHLLVIAFSKVGTEQDIDLQFAIARTTPSRKDEEMVILFCSEYHSR